eukprot:TRINITY_DN72494_c0_g1_i1.p2 TRINITY_DN72494_c0_g1~~TRINITY_DN72494_c0_g1_i1.p2  ORF type:complete len:133 (+),score=19.54 TRINITY_DN72494_c0_g1_i1:86-484(+)
MHAPVYRSDGSGRDAYIHQQVRHPVSHKIAARADTLPPNVIQHLRDQTDKEQYRTYVAEKQRLTNVNSPWEEARGKGTLPTAKFQAQAQARMDAAELKVVRQRRLKDLYDSEARQWNAELARMGYSVEKYRG